MKGSTKIPELEARLEQNKAKRWTDEIDQALLDYFIQFAHDKDTATLTKYINEKFDRQFTSAALSRRYYSNLNSGEVSDATD